MLPYQELAAERLPRDQVTAFVNYRSEAGRMAGEHWHLCSEMLFVFDGQGVQTLNGERFVFRSGDAFYIAPGTVHATVSEEERCYIGVTQFYCSGNLPSLHLPAGQMGSEAAALFSRLQEESTLRRPGYVSMVQGLTFQALGLMERYGTEVGHMPSDAGEAQKMAAYLRSHLTERMTLSDAAKAAGYSPAYFSRLFHEWMGMPFKAYMDELKIQAAKVMLSEGMTAVSVAGMLQYETPSSFSRTFRRITGQTPSDYRSAVQTQKKDRNP